VSWLLDADVLSQPAKRLGDARVVAWIEDQQDECYTSSIVIAQLAFWVRTKQGRPREALQAWLARLTDAMRGRVLGFSVAVAHVWAEQQHLLKKAGQRMPVENSYIAAIARHHNLVTPRVTTRIIGVPG
jgi:predicted nucleic acid-binding protein